MDLFLVLDTVNSHTLSGLKLQTCGTGWGCARGACEALHPIRELRKVSTVAHAFNPSTWEEEARGSGISRVKPAGWLSG